MQHSYDLVFQAKQVGEAIPLEGLIKSLTEQGAVLAPDGRGTWKRQLGELTLGPIVEGPKVIGLDVRCPFREKTELVEDMLKTMLDVAEANAGVRVMDPQRGDEATLTTMGSVLDEYLRMARYAGEYGGVGEALGLSSYAMPTQPEQESSPFRWMMIFVVLLVAVYVGWRAMSIRQERPPEPPRQLKNPAK
ncbi:MAG: hypothetical protein QM817_19095 [Archangium sp.]